MTTRLCLAIAIGLACSVAIKCAQTSDLLRLAADWARPVWELGAYLLNL